MQRSKDLLYAVVGVGDLALEKAKNLRKVTDKKATQKAYKDLVKRGQSLSNNLQSTAPAKRAIAQTKSAGAQVKSAADSVTKVVRPSTRKPTEAKAPKTKTAKAS